MTNGQQGSRSNSTKLYTIPGEPCRAPANGVVVLARAVLPSPATRWSLTTAAGMRSYLYGLQALAVVRGTDGGKRGQAVGALGEELTMDFKLGSKSVNPLAAVPDLRRLFWKENG